MSDSTRVAAPPLPFRIEESPFAASGAVEAGSDDSRALQAAIAAATQPVGGKRPRPADADEGGAADPRSPPPRQGAGGKHRPPRPPSFVESSGMDLELSLVQRQAAAKQAGSSPRQSGRSPRSPAGGGAPPAGRRPAKQLSKTLGRICIECGTSSTTQWRSQGLLCNSCGVKLIKGRLPMDADSMHRRFLRLPPAIRDHPMWAAAQVVAAAQGRAAADAAAGQPWACPGCGQQGCERVAGPCGLHQCEVCMTRCQLPLGGAAAVAAAVAAPPGAPTPSPSPSPGSGAPGHKRRKQATPRSAHGGLSPASISSSGSSSIQAYSFQTAREEGIDDATSKEPSPQHARPARRARQPHGRTATPASAAALAPHLARAPLDTPTAAEAAAALLVLTESDELRVAHAAQMDAAAGAGGAQPGSVVAELAVGPAAAPAGAARAAQPSLPARVPPVTPAEREPHTTAAKAASDKPSVARSLAAALEQEQGAGGGAAAPATADDAVGLYQLLIDASVAPEGAHAGLTAELVGLFLAAHTMQAQAERQARLVALMVRQGQVTAAVSLMQGVVKLAGLGS